MMKFGATRAACLAAIIAIYPLTGSALDIEPSITVGEIYTSNVNLTSDNVEPLRVQGRLGDQGRAARSDWLRGSRLDLDIDYTLEALLYAKDSDRNDVYNQLSAAGLLDLIGEDLQLRADGSISQVNISPDEPVTNSNINTTGNRANATIWSIGPEWQHRMFSNSEVDGHLSVGHVDYNEPSNQDTNTTQLQNVTTTSGRIVGAYGRRHPEHGEL